MSENASLKIWQTIQPMVRKEIARGTESSVKSKKMVVTTAYDATTKTVGVTEAFGKEIQVPASETINPNSLTVGTAVWVVALHGSWSNAIVLMLGDGGTGTGVLDTETVIAKLTEVQASVAQAETAANQAAQTAEEAKTTAENVIASIPDSYEDLSARVDGMATLRSADIDPAIAWEQGSLRSTTGDELSSTTRCRTGFITLNEGDTLLVEPNGQQYSVLLYDLSQVFSSVAIAAWEANSGSYTATQDCKARIVCSKIDSSDITPDDVTVKVALTEKIVSKVLEIEGSMRSTYLLDAENATMLESGTDFNDLKTPGNYIVYTAALAESMSHCPKGTAGRLIVTATTQSNRLIQTYNVNTNGCKVYTRYYNGSSWGSWNEQANMDDVAPLWGSNGELADADLDDVKDTGYYILTTAYSYVNTPADPNALKNGMLFVYTIGASTVQLFSGRTNGAGWYQRRFVSGAWTAWNTYATTDMIRKELKILCVGNSFNQDVMAYVPPILEELLPDVEITVATCYTSSASLQDHVDWFNAGTPYTVYNEWAAGATEWARYSASTAMTLQQVLDRNDWDIITMQGTSSDVLTDDDVDSLIVTPGRQLLRILQSNAQKPFEAMWFQWMGRPQGSYTALDMFGFINSATQSVMQKLGMLDYVPVGAAIQSARTNSVLGALGDGGDMLYSDAVHMQAGLPALIAAYTTALKVLEWYGRKYTGLYGSTFAPDSATVEAINCAGMTHGDPVGVDPTYIRAAQEIAVLAVRNPDVVTDCKNIL